MLDEESKAVQEVARTTGQAIQAASGLGQFVAGVIAGPLEQAMGIVEDKLKYARWERQVRLIERSRVFLAQAGLNAPTRSLPMKLAVPLLQAAVLEDSDEMQDKWAQLLANALNSSSGVEVQCSLVQILESLSPLEARALDLIYALAESDGEVRGIYTVDLPHSVRWLETTENPPTVPFAPGIELALANLVRLGCVSSSSFWDGGQHLSIVYPAILGRTLVRACRVEKAIGEPPPTWAPHAR